MEFLVWVDVRLPEDMAADRLQAIRMAELDKGRRLRQEGIIQRIWRLPGTTANVGVWRADDADELHAHLTSLPLFPWLNVEVRPLASHPVEGSRPPT